MNKNMQPKRGYIMRVNFAKIPYLCSRCGRKLIRQIGSAGFFWGCSFYPRCKKTFGDDHGKPRIHAKFDYTCPNCRVGHVIKYKCREDYRWTCDSPDCQSSFAALKKK